MSNSFWDKEKVSEWEGLEETIEDIDEILEEYEEPSYEDEGEYEEEYEEEVVSDYKPVSKKVPYALNKHENHVVNDAMVRLEQARLYDMLIKHDLFKGVKVNQTALRNVQNELKAYIVSRLEILLGIRKEKVERDIPKQVQVELPFNDIEIEFLKALSYKGTKGASAQADSRKVVATEVLPTIAASQQENEYGGLQPLSDGYEEEYEEEEYQEPVRKPAPKKVVKKRPVNKQVPQKRLAPPKQLKKPVAVQTPKPSRAKMNRKGEISNAEAERIAKEDIERMKKFKKPAHKMNAQELLDANASINSGRTKVEGAKPMPNPNQMDMYYRQKQANAIGNPGNNGFNALLDTILNNKK